MFKTKSLPRQRWFSYGAPSLIYRCRLLLKTWIDGIFWNSVRFHCFPRVLISRENISEDVTGYHLKCERALSKIGQVIFENALWPHFDHFSPPRYGRITLCSKLFLTSVYVYTTQVKNKYIKLDPPTNITSNERVFFFTGRCWYCGPVPVSYTHLTLPTILRV